MTTHSPCTVVPSLPANSFSELETLVQALDGVSPELQVDLVDGQFVPAVSWPFTQAQPLTELARLRTLDKAIAIECDCMVRAPEQYLDTFVAVGVARVIVHYGSTDAYADIATHAKAQQYRLGLAITNDVSLTAVTSLLPLFSFIQVMGIAQVGSQGQPFDERTPETIRQLRAAHPTLEIAVDGAVNKETIPVLREAGATRLAPGSAIAKAADPKAAYQALAALACAAA